MNLIRNIVGLIIIMLMLPLCSLVFRYTSDISFNYNEINDEIALMQLRELLLIAYDLDVSDKQMNFIYKNKDFRLSNVNNKLLLQPGSQIFLNDIDELFFDCKNGCVYVCYRRKNKEYERVISKQEGLYIDDFSDCDVLAFSSDNSEE